MPKNKFYVTTPIYYANAEAHIGAAYTTIIADALARWNKLRGNKVFFLTGTDEHGQNIQETAEQQNKNPKEFVDEISKKFKEVFKLLNISNDHFLRTTDKKHKKEVQRILQELYKNEFIYKGHYEGYYCVGCEQYLTSSDLVEGLCPLHKKAPELRKEDAYLFKLSSFQDKLINLIESGEYTILPETTRKEVINFIKSGLKDISVSRLKEKVYWGIELPFDKKHTCFVWVDAFWNYLTGLKINKKFNTFWPPDVQLMARDIIRVHSTIWPALLLATGNKLPKTLFVHGYFTVNGQKMSKSLGNVINPRHLVNKYGADSLRYFFLREIPAGQDGDFSEGVLIERCNADLANTVGNLLQRTVVLIYKNFNGVIPKISSLQEVDQKIIGKSNISAEVDQFMLKFEWHKSLEKIIEFVHECNKYINETQPWKVEDKKRLGTILYVLVECLRITSILVSPFIPETAEKISKQLGQKLGDWKKVEFKKNTKGKLTPANIIFPKLTKSVADHFSDFDLRVGVVKKVENHPNADKLYKLTVDIGEERTLVAGLKQHYSPDELTGKLIIVVKNMKPANIRGVESKGMLLAGDKDGKVRVLEAKSARPGDQVSVEDIPSNPKDQVTIEEVLSLKIIVREGKAQYKGKWLVVGGKEVTSEAPDGAKVR